MSIVKKWSDATRRLNIATKKAIFSGTALVLLFITFALLKPDLFLEKQNLINITQQVVTYAIIGYGLTFTLVCGGTDLSAGASMAVGGIIATMLIINGWPIVGAIVAAIFFGFLMGILNGFSIEVLGVVPFIATLGTQWVFRGLANILVKGAPVYTSDITDQAKRASYELIGGGRISDSIPIIGNVPFSVIVMLLYGIVLFIILTRTQIGRQIYACGSNKEAAKLSGINVVGTRMFAYCISGISAVTCGILVASRIASAHPNAGVGYEMEAIAASVVGGVSVDGGEGNILNTIIGALIMGVLRNGLNLNGVSSYVQQVIIGIIVVVTCAIEVRRRKRQG